MKKRQAELLMAAMIVSSVIAAEMPASAKPLDVIERYMGKGKYVEQVNASGLDSSKEAGTQEESAAGAHTAGGKEMPEENSAGSAAEEEVSAGAEGAASEETAAEKGASDREKEGHRESESGIQQKKEDTSGKEQAETVAAEEIEAESAGQSGKETEDTEQEEKNTENTGKGEKDTESAGQRPEGAGNAGQSWKETENTGQGEKAAVGTELKAAEAVTETQEKTGEESQAGTEEKAQEQTEAAQKQQEESAGSGNTTDKSEINEEGAGGLDTATDGSELDEEGADVLVTKDGNETHEEDIVGQDTADGSERRQENADGPDMKAGEKTLGEAESSMKEKPAPKAVPLQTGKEEEKRENKTEEKTDHKTEHKTEVSADAGEGTRAKENTGTLSITGVEEGAAYREEAVLKISCGQEDTAPVRLTLERTRPGHIGEDVTDVIRKSGSNTYEAVLGEDMEQDGIYTLTAEVTDSSGSRRKEVRHFTVNRNGSVYQYGESTMGVQGRVLRKMQQKLMITEYNPSPLRTASSGIEITRDGVPMKHVMYSVSPSSGDASGIGSSGWYQYEYEISPQNFLADGMYRISLSSADAAGNVGDSGTGSGGEIRFGIDHTSPSVIAVSGLEETVVRGDSHTVTFRVFDAMSLGKVTVMVDGKTVSEEKHFANPNCYEGCFVLRKGTGHHVRIIAEDAAGNVLDTDRRGRDGKYQFAPSFPFVRDVKVLKAEAGQGAENVQEDAAGQKADRKGGLVLAESAELSGNEQSVTAEEGSESEENRAAKRSEAVTGFLSLTTGLAAVIFRIFRFR